MRISNENKMNAYLDVTLILNNNFKKRILKEEISRYNNLNLFRKRRKANVYS